MFERFENALSLWLHERAKERAMKRFGGIQRCPWCKQWAQLHEGWFFDSHTDPTIDALHCGNCKGVSRWRFEMGMMPLDPIGRTCPPVPFASDKGKT